MAAIVFPSTLRLLKMTWAQHRNDAQFRSPFGVQSVASSQPVWAVSLQAPPMLEADAGAWKAFLMQLRGSTNQVALWDNQRPAPVGTLRGSPTLAVAASAGDTSISIAGGAANAGATLLAGDLLGFGTGTTQQVVMVMAPATADGSGNITATFEPPLRNAFAIGAAITWDKPMALFRVQSQQPGWEYAPGKITSGFSLDLLEDWRT